MWNKLLLFLGQQIISRIIEAIMEWNNARKNKKKVSKKVKEIMKDETITAEERARRLNDLLNT